MRKIKNIDCGKLKIIFTFSYFISEIPNLSYMRLFRKGSMFRRSIPLRYLGNVCCKSSTYRYLVDIFKNFLSRQDNSKTFLRFLVLAGLVLVKKHEK